MYHFLFKEFELASLKLLCSQYYFSLPLLIRHSDSEYYLEVCLVDFNETLQSALKRKVPYSENSLLVPFKLNYVLEVVVVVVVISFEMFLLLFVGILCDIAR